MCCSKFDPVLNLRLGAFRGCVVSDDGVYRKVNTNDDFQRSFTHTRPKPSVPPPTARPNQNSLQHSPLSRENVKTK
jgi:hypothetical protein